MSTTTKHPRLKFKIHKINKQKDAYKVEQINKRNEPGWANNTVNDNMS